MKLLAFDTATPVTSVAVVLDGAVSAEMSITGDKVQMERLMPMIDTVLKEAGCTIGEIEGLAVGTGPGLFTSLRIGVVTANTLAQVLKIPVVGISSLEALAHGSTARSGLVAATIDARRGEVFAAVYESENGRATEMKPAGVMKPDDFALELAAFGKPIHLVGDGFAAYCSIFKDVLVGLAIPASPDRMFPRASSVADLAQSLLEMANKHATGLVKPIYIRQPDAVEHIKKMKR